MRSTREELSGVPSNNDRQTTLLLACFSISIAACGFIANEPLPKVKSWLEVPNCTLPEPAALLVAGDDIETCRPDGGEYWADVGLTISAEGHGTALRIGPVTTPSVADCIRKLVPTMKYLVSDPCHKGSVDIDLGFGQGGVP
jgi:hypothetical protein